MKTLRLVCGEKKRTGGKLVKICLKIENEIVEGILITGDFFADPDLLDKINEELKDVRVPMDKTINFVLEKIKKEDLELLGVTLNDMADALKKALFRS